MMRFERFTERAQDAAARAYEILHRYGHNQVDTEHILLALLEQQDSIVSAILGKINIDVAAVRDEVDKILRASPKAAIYGSSGSGQVFITPRVKRIIDLAKEEANRLQHAYISPGHIFLGILREPNTAISRMMEARGITRDRVYDLVPDESEVSDRFDTERFNEQAQNATTIVDEILQRYGQDRIDTEHILMGLLEEPDGTVPEILQQMGVDTNTLRNQLDGVLRAAPKRQILLVPRAMKVMQTAGKLAAEQKDEGISVEQLFRAILHEQNSVVSKLIADHGITRDRVDEVITKMRSKGQSQS
jgi:ATP-dependent Clp protease ATP-binding subunit ClpA